MSWLGGHSPPLHTRAHACARSRTRTLWTMCRQGAKGSVPPTSYVLGGINLAHASTHGGRWGPQPMAAHSRIHITQYTHTVSYTVCTQMREGGGCRSPWQHIATYILHTYDAHTHTYALLLFPRSLCVGWFPHDHSVGCVPMTPVCRVFSVESCGGDSIHE